MPAYVYLIEEVPHEGESSGPWTKIGYSQNPPEWRMDANLKRGNPRRIRIAAAFEFSSNEEAYATEQKAHEQFSAHKCEKEWFRMSWTEIAEWMEGTGAKQRKPPTS